MWRGGVRMDYMTAEMFAAPTKDTLSFAPGTAWQYSDVGFFLLGMVMSTTR